MNEAKPGAWLIRPSKPSTLLHRSTALVCASRAAALRSLFTLVRASRANDPSAGSPTETLLRLLLPLSDKVH